mmetsp:Transcript_36616/g.97669  ORF Transcript_36616/g.97669 Transcript_36616/m.97669 type:complete len:207 (-) Transcript_36616:209-829(-)|eukprot:CAMPEP_0194525248 /NCGR_PEP_ID=MMETSP0253-20130528/60645_1 /TAXON_ID=2966 /ORGANISM="Noctiluca scintillans" /LENGTH=206 /DNA_ID=CAMNT_0039369955 /DNA_START=171 /DNA_END=794 /DNA_ORIENTATION=+
MAEFQEPKRPHNPYMLFQLDNLADLKKRFASKSQADKMRAIGLEWKTLPDERREAYVERARELVAQYDEEMEKFKAAGGERRGRKRDTMKIGRPKKSAKKDPNMPKRPPNAYFLFFIERKKEFVESGDRVNNAAKALGAAWAALSDEDRAPYLEQAAQHKKVYADEVKRYRATLSAAYDDEVDHDKVDDDEVPCDEVDDDDDGDDD